MTIGALALDAPKRTRDIVAIYKKLAGRILPGQTILAWQDFLHPASFEIPACLGMLTRLQTPVHVVSTGTLVGLQIDANWSEADIDEDRLNFRNWSRSDAEDIWQYWAPLVPDRETASFESGLCMLLHDLGRVDEARKRIVPLLKDDLCLRRWKKWLPTSLSDKYKPLFELV